MQKCNRYYTTKQHHNYDCGITCTLNILRCFGKQVSRNDFKYLLHDTKIKKNGASMYDLICAIKKYGLEAEGARCNWKTLSRKGICPAIIVVEISPKNFHYIIVHEVSNTTITIADPSIWTARISRMSLRKFNNRYCWRGEAIIIPNEIKITKSGGRPMEQYSLEQKNKLFN